MKQNNMIVIYKSSTGFTKRYAELVAKEMGCAIEDYRNVSSGMLSKYDIVIFGTRAHAGRADGFQKAKRLFEKSNISKMILFVTGATPNAATEIVETFWRQNLSAEEMTKIPHFYMQSGLCYEKMSLPDRLMMKVAAIMIRHKKNKTEQDLGFEEGIKSSFDNSSKEYIEPLISYLRTNAQYDKK